MKIRWVKNGHSILEFSVQYEALINGHWRKITRYDSAHGQPHRHVYRPNGKEYKHMLIVDDINAGLTEALLMTKKNFLLMKESYILGMRTNGGG